MNILLGLTFALETLDGTITYWAINNDLATEWNNLVSQIAGNWQFLFFKILGGAITVVLLWTIKKKFPKITLVTTSSIFIFYMGVIIWNLNILGINHLC